MDSAINGLLQSLDPYSSYMSPEIFQEMQTETSGEFGGLGIEVSMEAGVVKVITPIDDTPASKAGIKAGDYIVKIDNVQVQGKSLSEAVDLMRGLVGTDIELTVRRRGVKKALTFNITRKIIEVQSVKSDLLENNIGYIRLTSFNDNSSDQIKKKIKKLKENVNLKAFILDLRNNPGGLLSQAIKGIPLTVFGDGTQTRSFCHVEDAVDDIISKMNELKSMLKSGKQIPSELKTRIFHNLDEMGPYLRQPFYDPIFQVF